MNEWFKVYQTYCPNAFQKPVHNIPISNRALFKKKKTLLIIYWKEDFIISNYISDYMMRVNIFSMYLFILGIRILY